MFTRPRLTLRSCKQGINDPLERFPGVAPPKEHEITSIESGTAGELGIVPKSRSDRQLPVPNFAIQCGEELGSAKTVMTLVYTRERINVHNGKGIQTYIVHTKAQATIVLGNEDN